MYFNNKSSEDYLETILKIQETQPTVRSVDIVHATGFKKSSVSVAMKKLRESGHIKMDNEGYITLTAKGVELANIVYSKHKFLCNLFIKMGVSKETAEIDACNIEHEISDETFNCMVEYAKTHC